MVAAIYQVPQSPTSATAGAPGSLDAAKSLSVATDILGLQSKAAEDAANAQAQDIISRGDAAEADAYGTAGKIARSNADLEAVSGQVQQMQQARALTKTLGAQRADVAAAGFGDSGSALYLARDSLKQGYLKQQVTGLNSSIQAGGFLAQGAAADAEGMAATAASGAAAALAASERTAGDLARANSVAEANALIGSTATPKPYFDGTKWVGGLAADPLTGLPLSNPTLGGTGNPATDAARRIGQTAAAGQTLNPTDLASLVAPEASTPFFQPRPPVTVTLPPHSRGFVTPSG